MKFIFMGMLLHAKVIIILNYKNKFCTKYFNNCKQISIIQIIYVNNYALFLYVIVKKENYFFGIKKY